MQCGATVVIGLEGVRTNRNEMPYRRELPVSGCAHQRSEAGLELRPLGFGVAVLLLSAARRVDAYTALEDHLDQIESSECRCVVQHAEAITTGIAGVQESRFGI